MSVFLPGVGAACCLGVGFVLQQRQAQRAPLSDSLFFRLLLGLMRHPQWLVGIAAMIVGMALSTIALANGEVSLVEPLTATNLLFAMALSRWLTGQPLGWNGWGGVLLLALGVTGFLVAGQPSEGGHLAGPLRQWILFGIVVGLAGLLVTLARHLRPALQAAVLACAAGLLYGLQDSLTRISSRIVSRHGIAVLFAHWQPYVVACLGVTGLVLVQTAFQAAPLRSSLPALTAAQPLAGIASGVGIIGDRLQATPGALTVQTVGLMTMVIGIVLIGRHPCVAPEVPHGR
ncbi:DMT family transporter [Streptomyces sp. DSM 118148]|uniref:DMT family transporter n=1 Tax=Streptomyces sp. DSM 118148 TaxID=3448667 RepID=UPI00403FD86F